MLRLWDFVVSHNLFSCKFIEVDSLFFVSMNYSFAYFFIHLFMTFANIAIKKQIRKNATLCTVTQRIHILYIYILYIIYYIL